MGVLSFTLVRCEGEEAEDTSEISFGDGSTIDMFVGDLGNCSHGILSGLHVVGLESSIASSDALYETCCLIKKWSKGLLGEGISKRTDSISYGMSDNIVLHERLIG